MARLRPPQQAMPTQAPKGRLLPACQPFFTAFSLSIPRAFIANFS